MRDTSFGKRPAAGSLGSSTMIQNDQELKVTRERISYLLDLLSRLRISSRPEELGLVSGGYRAEVERMQRLVADLLALTRLDEGRLKLRLTTVEVSPLLAGVCMQMQSQVHGQSLTYQVPPGLPALRGDADQLRRVLLNIVENALKFTPPGGYVELRAANEK